MTQHLTIPGWLPEPLTNGPHGHWSVKQRKLQAAQTMVWSAAKQADWTPVKEFAVLTINLVFPVKRVRDRDGIYSRVKGCVDGLVRGGWIADDSMEHIDLRVTAEVRRGVRQTEITLAPAVGQ